MLLWDAEAWGKAALGCMISSLYRQQPKKQRKQELFQVSRCPVLNTDYRIAKTAVLHRGPPD